jgi:hypothetical protein
MTMTRWRRWMATTDPSPKSLHAHPRPPQPMRILQIPRHMKSTYAIEGGGAKGTAKRARLSGRDLQLTTAVASNRVEVAKMSAKLRDGATIQDTKMSIRSKEELMKQLVACADRATSVQQQSADNQEAAVNVQRLQRSRAVKS